MIREFRLPELGENIEGGDVVQVHVSKGDSVSKDQVILELETDKATIEVPSTFAGKVKDVHVKAGDAAEVGQLILTIEAGEDGESKEAEPEKKDKGKEKEPEKKDEAAEKEKKAEEKKPKSEKEEEKEEPEQDEEPAPKREEKVSEPEPSKAPESGIKPASGKLAPASPSVRRFAREIGVDVNAVPGTGPGGRISIDDVKRYSKDLHAKRATPAGSPGMLAAPDLPNFAKWGDIEREKMTNIRKATVSSMAQAWNLIPHVTQHDKADITDLENLRKSFSPQAEAAGTKLTVTAILIKVAVAALKKFPKFNCSIDVTNSEVIYKKYYNIGVAVDTERGLLVPVIKNADQKNMLEIAKELGDLAEKARNKKLGLDEMQGGTFTVTNLGGIGGTSFTPIVNWPEVSILGVSRGSQEAIFRDGKFEPRLMLPLSLSYDHRIVDGADAARFLRWICSALEQPFMIALEG